MQVIVHFLPFLQSWDAALARSAKAWAKKCKFKHNTYLEMPGKMHPTFHFVGENIWTGTAHIFSVEAALRSWFNEVSSYDFSTNTCTDMCGHYTQVSLTCPVLYSLTYSLIYRYSLISLKIWAQAWNRLLWDRNYSRALQPTVYCCMRLEINMSPRDLKFYFQ